MQAGQSVVSASLEDYLESIYHIEASNGAARAKDIAVAMKVKNASVTQALRSLAEKSLVNYAPYAVITLTPRGREIALDVVRRHEILEMFLSQVLGLPGDQADENACRLEHAVSPPVLDRLIKFVEYFRSCPLSKTSWDEDEESYFCGGGAEGESSSDTCGRDICEHQTLDLAALDSTDKTNEAKE